VKPNQTKWEKIKEKESSQKTEKKENV